MGGYWYSCMWLNRKVSKSTQKTLPSSALGPSIWHLISPGRSSMDTLLTFGTFLVINKCRKFVSQNKIETEQSSCMHYLPKSFMLNLPLNLPADYTWVETGSALYHAVMCSRCCCTAPTFYSIPHFALRWALFLHTLGIGASFILSGFYFV